MNNSAKTSTSSRVGWFGDGFDIGKMLLEGRAFFALIVIVIIFSLALLKMEWLMRLTRHAD
jgi:erythritol transport system permease protein